MSKTREDEEAAMVQKENTPEKKNVQTKGENRASVETKAPGTKSPEAAKKKKKIIIINNSQSSGSKSTSSGQGMNYSSQSGYNNPGNISRGNGSRSSQQGASSRSQNSARERQQQRTPVKPIKPLTPPSPTPSVQIASSRPQPRKSNVSVSESKAETQIKDAVKSPEPETQHTESQPVNTPPASASAPAPAPAHSEVEETVAAATKKVPKEQSAGNKDDREKSPEKAAEQMRSVEKGTSQPAASPEKTSGSRSDEEKGVQSREGTFSEKKHFDVRNRSAESRNTHASEGRGGTGNGRTYSGRQESYQGSGKTRFNGTTDSQSDRRGGASGQSDRRSFGNMGRDERGNARTQDRSRNQGGAKGYTPDTSSKDIEKKREEDKRRFNQERDKNRRKDMMYDREEEESRNKPGRFIKPEKKKETQEEDSIRVVTVPDSITVKDFADLIRQQPSALIKKLFMAGKAVTMNQEISFEEAESLAMDYDILCEREEKVDVVEELLKEEEDAEDTLVERSPVVCVMGHVDHGKTSLLDAIRKTNVTDSEAGGITQRIGAYTVNVGDRKITFLDTPGHEAFTAMRMRGAKSTDIAILVVAADDGVMPQTVEAINHARAAGIEIIVAINKIDKPGADVDRVKRELTEYELVSEEWGGNTVMTPISAKTGEGIDQLLEMVLLTADIMELKANPNRKARGIVIEAQLDKGRGPVATALIQKGTLHVGDFVSAGSAHGKVRAMIDDKGNRVNEAGPSTPVEILGLSDVPEAGEVILAHKSDKDAKFYADAYLDRNKEKMIEESKSRMSLDDLFSKIQEGNLKELNLIIKADVQGSVEAVKTSMLKLSNDEIVVKCIHAGVGNINESDVMLAMASNAIIIGFNVKTDPSAKSHAEQENVDIRIYDVIYKAIEDVEAAMKGMLDPIYEEKIIGHAQVRQIFRASAIGNIAGSYVLDGVIQRGCKVRVTRDDELQFEGNLSSLRRFKDDVKEVRAGFECGLVFEGYDKMNVDDIVEAYVMVEVPR